MSAAPPALAWLVVVRNPGRGSLPAQKRAASAVGNGRRQVLNATRRSCEAMVSHVLDVFQEDQNHRADPPGPSRRFAADITAARAAFGADSGYAAEMAKAAVAVAGREHAARLRAALARGAARATAACGLARGQFTCSVTSACGTGDCRFACGLPAGTAAAGPGRLARPVNHVRAGEGFGTGPALAALMAAVPFTVAARVTGADSACASDQPAA